MTPAGSALKGDGPRDEKGENGRAAAGRGPEGGTLLSQGQHPEEYSTLAFFWASAIPRRSTLMDGPEEQGDRKDSNSMALGVGQ